MILLEEVANGHGAAASGRWVVVSGYAIFPKRTVPPQLISRLIAEGRSGRQDIGRQGHLISAYLG